jgi:tetratricopeptide (TPR) repeat protein
MSEEPEDDLRRSLAHLQAAEFLYETRLFPDLEYTFKHALTHQVAYGSLLAQRRRALHAGIVDAIERHHSDRLAEHVERLAYHAFRGERWDRAVRYAHEAGTKVYARSAASEAVAHFEQAMAALRHLPETRAAVEQAIDLRLALRNPLAQLLEYQRTLEHLREAEKLATAIADESRLGRVLALLAFSLYQAGQYDEANRYGERALTVGARRREAEIETPANFYLAQAHFLQGRYRDAMALYDRAFAASGWPAPRRLTRPAAIRTWSAVCLAEMGQFDEAMARSDEALEIAGAMDEPFSIVAAHFGAGTVRLARGDLAPAIRLLERGLDLCRASQVAMYLHRLLAALGHAYGLVARAHEGLALLREADQIQRSRGAVAALPRTLTALGEVSLVAGQRGEGERAAHEALAIAGAQGERGGEAWALHLLGRAASGADSRRDEEAAAYYRRALRLATDLGMLPLAAHCHLGLGKLFWPPDERDQASAHVKTAMAMYAEMGMRFWLERTTPTDRA